MSVISRTVRKKRKTQAFHWKTETKSSPSMETCRTGKWGDICPAHAWQVNKTEHGGSPDVSASDILSLCKLRRGKSAFMFYVGALHGCFTGRWFFPESRMHSLSKALRTGRHMWKELSVPGRQGTKPLLLELGQSSHTWKPHSSSGFGELSCVLAKPAEREAHCLQGLVGHRALWNASTPSLSWLPCALFSPRDALNVPSLS